MELKGIRASGMTRSVGITRRSKSALRKWLHQFILILILLPPQVVYDESGRGPLDLVIRTVLPL